MTAQPKNLRPQLNKTTRQYVLLIHVAMSVAWLGAGAANLVISFMVYLRYPDLQPLAAFSIMAQVDYWVIIPCAFGALITGTVLSLFTKWGLIKHWWVLIKFVLTSIVILSATFGVGFWVEDNILRVKAGHDFANGIPMIVTGAANLLSFVFMVWLSILKPLGRTPWGVASLKATPRRGARRSGGDEPALRETT